MTRELVGVLRAVREDRRRRWLGLALGAVLGITAATLHPLGLVVGGAAVGLVSRTLPRALGAGLAFGLLALVVFLLSIPATPGRFAALTPISALAVAIGLIGPLLGSLTRGIV